MAKLIVSIDGVVIRELVLSKARTTIGRRPYNDLVIDNLAVSGEHALIQASGADYFAEDLNSTNGSYLNGKALKRERIHHNDTIEIGKYKIKFVANDTPTSHDEGDTPLSNSVSVSQKAADHAKVQLLSGASSGREVPLTKVVTTVGKPGVAVASITKRLSGYVLSHVDGDGPTLLNGQPIGSDPTPLADGDTIELAGTQMRFIES